MVFIKCTNFVSAPKLKLFFPVLDTVQKNGGSRKEGKDIIGRKLEGKMPVDGPWTDGILRRIQSLKLFAKFSRIFQKTKFT